MGKGALGQLAAYWPEDTARYAHVPLKRVGDLTIHPIAAGAPERPALLSAAGTTTYGALSERVKRLAQSLRGRLAKGSRVAISLPDAADLAAALFACFENELLAFASSTPLDAETLRLFGPDLVIGRAADHPSVDFAALLVEEATKEPERPDFKKPLLALPSQSRQGEVLHNHKTLGATAIAVGSFFLMDAETRIWLAEPPTGWLGLSILLGAWQKGAAVLAGWENDPPAVPDRVDYFVIGWETALRRFVDGPPRIPQLHVGAGALVGIERPFAVSRRRRLSRRLGTPVLTLLGRNDLGPVIGSHPTWFLDDAAGIPLPNVDTRPMNPRDGTPLNIGWDAVEEAELGVKSALSPLGAPAIDGWLRSEIVAAIDPTGLYFLSR